MTVSASPSTTNAEYADVRFVGKDEQRATNAVLLVGSAMSLAAGATVVCTSSSA
jgi:hypothetical protein